MPAAGFAEIALGRQQAKRSACRSIPWRSTARGRADAAPRRPHPGDTQLTRGADDKTRIEIYSRTPGGWTRHATARVEVASPDAAARSAGTRRRDGRDRGIAGRFVRRPALTGQNHGPAFAALTQIVRLAGRFGRKPRSPCPTGRPGIRVTGFTRSCSMRRCRAWPPRCRTRGAAPGPAETSYLPVSFEKIRVFGEVGRHARCRAELMDLDEGGAGKLGKVTLDRRRRKLDRRDHRHLPARVSNGAAVPMPLEQKIFDTAWVERPIADSRPARRSSGQLAGADR